MNHLLTYVLSGGFVSALLGIFTIRSKVGKSRAETGALNLENTDKATKILMDNIVEPLKQELYETRKEMALLRDAIRDANHCRYAPDCPVLHRVCGLEKSGDPGLSSDRGNAADSVLSSTAGCRGPDQDAS